MGFDTSDTDPSSNRTALANYPSFARTPHSFLREPLTSPPIIAAPSDSQTRMMALFPTRISNSHDLHRATQGVAESRWISETVALYCMRETAGMLTLHHSTLFPRVFQYYPLP
jgi:hypothetical protein